MVGEMEGVGDRVRGRPRERIRVINEAQWLRQKGLAFRNVQVQDD